MSEAVSEPAKFLCVDDDELILAAIRRLLSRDFRVLTAESGEEALEVIEQNPDIAVVLTDQRMRGMSGLELLAVVQQRLPDAVRAVLTGKINEAEMAEAINSARIHRLILKPWDNEYFRMQMLEALANHATLREMHVLERLSVTDPVTGLKNHRFFQDHLRIEADRAVRHQRPLSLIMGDIDHFKSFNDRFGHPAGDRLLKAVAQRLLDQVRSIDIVARYGGEEFAIILPDTPADPAMQVAERIRNCFERNPYEGPQGQSIDITISLGVASIPTNASASAELIAQADSALYQAKGQGRNKSVRA